jgi:hypothetical protein
MDADLCMGGPHDGQGRILQVAAREPQQITQGQQQRAARRAMGSRRPRLDRDGAVGGEPVPHGARFGDRAAGEGAPQAPSHLWRWRGGGLGLLLRDPLADSRVDPLADATVIAHVEMHHVAVGRTTPAEAYPFDEFLLEVHETGLA